MFLRKDDVVVVIAGDDKGARGKVLRVLRSRKQGGRGRHQPRVPAPEAVAQESRRGGRLSRRCRLTPPTSRLDPPRDR